MHYSHVSTITSIVFLLYILGIILFPALNLFSSSRCHTFALLKFFISKACILLFNILDNIRLCLLYHVNIDRATRPLPFLWTCISPLDVQHLIGSLTTVKPTSVVWEIMRYPLYLSVVDIDRLQIEEAAIRK